MSSTPETKMLRETRLCFKTHPQLHFMLPEYIIIHLKTLVDVYVCD